VGEAPARLTAQPEERLKRLGLVLLLPWCAATVAAAQTPRDSTLLARRLAMVELIARRGVTDSLTLRAMRAVPRHLFVPPGLIGSAYDDRPLPIGFGATISQPFVVAVMTAALRLRPGERVLEIGTGSGYQAAVLATLGCTVYTIEIVDSLAASAAARLARLGYDRVQVRLGDGWQGWPEAAPFDAIMVTAAPDSLPGVLITQLRRGGRMILPLGPQGLNQRLVIAEKNEAGRVTTRDLMAVRFVPMVR
jgi:protein-L-isoaspartate(D-aspartate) O-methyltransferase